MKIKYERKQQSSRFPRNFQPFLRQAADYGVSSTQRKIKEGIGPANAPLTRSVKKNNKTLRDRGNLLTSFTGKVTGHSAEVGTHYPPAQVLHNGAVIRPRKARYLYIPASAKTRSLMRRYGSTPGRCIQGMKASGYNIFYTRAAVMAKMQKNNPFVLFILKKEVKIPARPFLFLDATDRATLMKMLRNFIRGK